MQCSHERNAYVLNALEIPGDSFSRHPLGPSANTAKGTQTVAVFRCYLHKMFSTLPRDSQWKGNAGEC
ncbi:hypothetical protein XELAEV_18011656mg [Xenopus laevis]|uniref:Uncharacterized protein n=1 Tax=Xenopus laevis TaxID=8355 RepID=A0A974HXP0_XENLA|nr:hypothetical protein XELAEV_18011656mg [Xenopus laevis]